MLSANERVGLVFFPAFDWAIDPLHPEREERLLYTQDQVFEEGILDIEGMVEFRPDLVTPEDVRRVHFCVPDVESVMTESHFVSAGGAVRIARAVTEGEIHRGFALVRPPGHHAMRVVPGGRGFCTVNNEAIMVEWLRRHHGVRKVAIVDTDCHHGDGTEDIYWHDPDTLVISLHQDGRTLYPGTGFPQELGGPNASGTTINIPLPPNTSDSGYLMIMRETVLPIIEEFGPELIINSAGQDNHFTDPLTNMNFTARGYAELTGLLKPDIAVLEGGYSIESALPYVNVAVILALAGLDYSKVVEPDLRPYTRVQSTEVTETVMKIAERTRVNWERRHEDAAAYRRNGQEFLVRKRQHYFDTDDFMEYQTETVRVCDGCAGAVMIDSMTDRGARVLAIQIPREACPACRKAGRQWFEDGHKQRPGQVHLQDRPNDEYLVG